MARKDPVSMGAKANHLLLRAEKATLFDFTAILFSSGIGKLSSVQISKALEENVEHRFMIFWSLLAQKILLFIQNPLAVVGSMLEILLNTLAFNGGFFKLIFNIFWGKVLIPDNMASNYVSIIGNLDTRVLLDTQISPGDSKYKGALSLMAAKMAYENRSFTEAVVSNYWKMHFLGAYDFWNECVNENVTHAFLMLDKSSVPETYIVSFRGTRPSNAYDWCSDFDISWYEIPGVGIAHAGFMEALGMQATGWPKEIKVDPNTTQHQLAYYFLKKKLTDVLEQSSQARFILTGHSMGGALAVLFASILAINQEDWLLKRLQGVYTFGQPRVGDERFGDFVSKRFSKYGVKYVRYVYCNDMVARLPWDDSGLLYRHFGTCVLFDSLYHQTVCKEVPDKNYSWVGLAMLLNAIWEIIRSFFIRVAVGRDYGEGWLQIWFRLSGLVLPGLPDHSLQDYNNSTRLGWGPSPP